LSFPFPTEDITEGAITCTVPKLALFAKGVHEYIPSKAPVFYNPRMELNRDSAIIALRTYQRRVNRHLYICDPLTGCGVRGLRIAREVVNVDFVILNDLSLQAAHLAWFNAEKNGLADKVIVTNMDARTLLGSHTTNGKFDMIDIDPYGSPSPFLDFAIAALKNNGLLALTATDTAPLCGVNPKACVRKYFGKPLRTEYSHELALRLLISSVVLSSARYDLGAVPLFSFSADHYLRLYVHLKHGALRANEAREKIGYVLHCFNCLNRKWILDIPSPLEIICDFCNKKMDIAGPLWLGQLSDRNFCREMWEGVGDTFAGAKKRLTQLLVLTLDEADMPPTYFMIDKICEKLGLRTISRDQIIDNLIKTGYQAVRTHFNPQGIKSNAPILAIKKAVKEASF